MSSQLKYEFLNIKGFMGGENGGCKNNDKYRWYHCYINDDSMNCKMVDNANSLPEKENSQCMFVYKHIPESLDAFVLKVKAYPENLITLTPLHLNTHFSTKPRQYYCTTKNGTPVCERIDSSVTPPPVYAFSGGRTQVMEISGSVPRLFDSSILKYRWMPKHVIIESKQS